MDDLINGTDGSAPSEATNANMSHGMHPLSDDVGVDLLNQPSEPLDAILSATAATTTSMADTGNVDALLLHESSSQPQQLSASTARNPINTTPLVNPEEVLLDDEESEEALIEEVFLDEPMTTPSKKKSKKAVAKRKGGRRRERNPLQQKSYWSSDDESPRLMHHQPVIARPKSPNNKPKDSSSTAIMKKAATTIVSFGRSRKTRSKRRTPRRAIKEDHDDGESSTTEDPDHPEHQTPPPQRKISSLKTPPPSSTGISSKNNSNNNSVVEDDKPPPIAIVRTKTKSKSPKTPSNNTSIINSTHGPSSSTGTPVVGTPRMQLPPNPSPAGPQHLSIEDMEICQRLDDEYENALEEREIGYMARYTSVRQAACASVVFMLIFLWLGTTFFMRYAGWTFHDSLLFSIYTITTVGYGNQAIPKEMGFQSFTILYIFVGIATLTIMVAQIYQCLALEASRAQHSRDKTEMARRGLDVLNHRNSNNREQQQQQQPSQGNTVPSSQASVANSSVLTHEHGMFFEDLAFVDTVMQYYERAKHFFSYNEYGRSLSVLLPFAGLIAVGACIVGPIEGWNAVEALYFAVVSLTTVGFGDYYPKHASSIWFCIAWLPFSIGFMSMFLKNVATFYIRLSAQNINRIERRMRRRLARSKEQFEFERAEALKRAYHGQAHGGELELHSFPSADSDDLVPPVTMTPTSKQQSIASSSNGSPLPRHMQRRRTDFDALPTSPKDASATSPVVKSSRASLFGSPGEGAGVFNRRERILKNSLEGGQNDFRPKGQTMDTMKDVIKAVHKSINSGGSDSRYLSMRSSVMKPVLGNSNEPMRKPSFALRALVQERFAEIIATDIAGFQSSIEIKDNTLSVTIDSLRYTAEKWCIPRRARKAFRAVAFEALYFVGEHGLITKGADALYALSPFEFHGLFSPLLAAMGDAGTMEGWLASTEVMAEYDLRNKSSGPSSAGDLETGTTNAQRSSVPTTSEKLHTATHRIRTEEGSLASMERVHPGNAFA
ncbi:Ion transport protein [Seminavis robusta]|uniref:Ion transport protein n=1 Tax=Seminavis robusta TaxID=568900 RepID=A0A9N8H606_9STRA|nr:Ion transport protein [Seminavis robusta]|eukprot:Sro87_g045950.1 Ion transport protein (1003) ;mRNA; f:16210-19293